ncbi:hypothetical protein JOC95_000462 [Bacillus tianshenii]|uniref:Uncharacterized protein n=1 Tax=Sutcliffiella tianshenii TaxID=1463404 RepID=A0ABS2NWJ9_9BACI|nr:hypothetical protein [Bacillus tianshenii]
MDRRVASGRPAVWRISGLAYRGIGGLANRQIGE